jgi:hypothetical protein
MGMVQAIIEEWELGLKEIHLNNDLLHRFYGMELSPVLKAIESHQDQVSCVPPNGIIWVILHRQILRYLQLETLYLVFKASIIKL